MVRAALAKLLVLVILTFILCLPEFFTLYRVSKVNFFCLPYQLCEEGNQAKKGEDGRRENSEDKQGDICNPSPTADHEKWRQICSQKYQRQFTDSDSAPETSGGVLRMSWFMCEADSDMDEMLSNISSSANRLNLEVSVQLQLNKKETLNLTLYGRNNHSSLHLHPPEEEEDEMADDGGRREALYCCLSPLPVSKSANHNQCLLWFANQTVLNETAKEKLPWKRTQEDEWQCVIRVIWLALLCVVFLVVATTVIREIYWKKLLREPSTKAKTHPTDHNLKGQELNDHEKQMGCVTPKGTALKSQRPYTLSGLSPIQEDENQNDMDTLLDGSADHCYTGKLHHRSHPTYFPESTC
ncbi:uncharacterized protein ACNS7B_008434 [Menidia menidia]